MTCKICNSEDIYLYLEGVYDDPNTNVYECKKCELQFLSPMMREEEEKQYYLDYYNEQSIRHTVKTDLDKIRDESYLYHKEYLNNYKEYLSNKDFKVLEIGSGTGGFIQLLKNDFNINKITIVEKSDSNIEYLKKEYSDLEVYQSIEDLNGKYDVIVAIALFEHIKEPMKFLEKLKSLLTKDGVIILEMPNKYEPLIELYNIEEFKKFNYQKQHYYTYCQKNLTVLLENLGFKIEQFYFTQVYSLDNHLSWINFKKRQDYSMFTKIISSKTLKSYKNDLINNKTTDAIGVVFKKD